MNEEKNYIREYYKQETHDLESLLNVDINEEEKVQEIKREIAKMQKSIELKSVELHNTLEKLYSNRFVPITQTNILDYDGRFDTFQYDIATGLLVESYDVGNAIIYTNNTKRDKIQVVVGYNYELASIIIKEYQYNISRDSQKMTTKCLKEKVISFMENKTATLDIETNNVSTYEGLTWHDEGVLEKIRDNTFINTLYGIDYKGNLNLKDLRQCNLHNKSFEIILKTAPQELMDDLLKLDVEQALPIHKIIGVSLETYNKAIERGVLRDLFDNRQYISNDNQATYGINKTENEWFELIDEMKHYEEDLSFYDIDFSSDSYYSRRNKESLLNTLLQSYTQDRYGNNIGIFKTHYSFGKFCNYVINETINQGYTRIRDFIRELYDYLSMCMEDNIKPTLYSSYLKQTHDITSRNHKVQVEKEKEETFQSRYKDFKTYNGKEYFVVAPKNSNDLKKEGDTLNHCVASYIKRVIDGECLIYFLRKDKEESLITFEVRHNDIVQVRGLHNRKPNDKEIQALKEFAKYRKLGCDF